MNGEFDFKSIESERQLSNFFGGEALIIYEPAMAVYQITVRNDDLINDFLFEIPREYTYCSERKKQELQKMLDKYIKQMEIEQQLLKKGVLKV